MRTITSLYISIRRTRGVVMCIRWRRTVLWTLFLATSFIPLSLATNRQPNAGPQTMSEPLWEVDLRALGYSGFAQRREQWGLHFHINPICFSENNSLIATFLTREAVTTLRQRDRSTEGLPLRLHAVFFDATAGKVRAVREWSASEPRGGIVTTRGEGLSSLPLAECCSIHLTWNS